METVVVMYIEGNLLHLQLTNKTFVDKLAYMWCKYDFLHLPVYKPLAPYTLLTKYCKLPNYVETYFS